MRAKTLKTLRVSAGAIFFLLALVLSAGVAHASPGYLADFTGMYPTSATANASCQVCHVNPNASPSSARNVYGAAWAAANYNFAVVGAQNSDGVGGTNDAEIAAGTQPGWCVKTTAGCLQQAGTPPAVPLDDVVAPPANQPPTANAGPDQAVNVGVTVQLDGSKSSDPNSDPLTYKWSLTKPTGSAAALSSATAPQPTFVADVAGTFTAQLIVNDGKVDSAADTVVIGAATPNQPPVANAGPAQTVTVGATVQLDGSKSSDPNSDPLTYKWSLTKPTGSAAALSSATAPQPTFVADVAGTFTAQLIVNDGKVDSISPANVVITANAGPAGNQPPVANAGPDQAVNVGATVQLDGSKSSDPNSDPLTYKWSLTKPTGSAAALSSASAQKPTFVADAAGDYVAQLIVNDGKVDSAADTVVIGAATPNQPPVANAGPAQAVTVGATVQLDGSKSSDPNSDPLTYKWSLTKPTGSAAALSSASAQKPTFVADAVGQYVVGLVVNDGKVNSTNTANVVITVQGPTPTPVCTMIVNPTSLAFGSVNVGTTKSLTTGIRNTGTANCAVSSLTVSGTAFALGSGAPSLPATVAPGATVNVPVNFAPTAAGAATGNLVIGAMQVSLSGTGATVTVPPPTNGAVDYSAQNFKATEEVELSKKQPVKLRLTVKNVGKVPGNAPATVVGMQNGSEIYRKTMAMSAPVGKTGTFDFPSYTPTAAGKIKWTVTIQDRGPEHNTATATTEVKREDKKETEHSDRKGS